MMLWVKDEEQYVCWKCWDKHYTATLGKESEDFDVHPYQNIGFNTMFLSMIIFFSLVGVYDIYIRAPWQDLEPVSIAEIEEGEIVRVEGFINESSDSVAIGGRETSGRRNRHSWRWHDDNKFIFSDSTGSIRVTTEDYYDIEKGPHPAPNRNHTKGTVYRGGDEVIIIGRVEGSGNLTSLHLLWVGTDEDDIQIWTYTYPITIGALAFVFYCYGHYLRIHLKRNRLHYQKVGHINPIPIEYVEHKDDEDLLWWKNVKIRKSIRFSLIMMSLSFAAFIWWSIYSYGQLHSKDQILFFWFVSSVIYISLIHFQLGLLFNKRNVRPMEVAISDQGIYFNYTDPVIQYLQDYHIRWDEIQEVQQRKVACNRCSIIQKEDGTMKNLWNVYEGIAARIIEHWENRVPQSYDDEFDSETEENNLTSPFH